MKWFIFLIIGYTSFFIDKKDGIITAQTDKEIYSLGDTIYVKVESDSLFRLATNGACSAQILSPVCVKEIDGKWDENYAVGRQMCCGLPYSQPMKKTEYTITTIQEKGKWKILIPIYGQMCETNSFVIE